MTTAVPEPSPAAPRLQDSLRLQLAALVLAVLLPLAAFAGFLLYQSAGQQEDIVRNLLFDRVRAGGAAFERIVDQQVRAAETVAAALATDPDDTEQAWRLLRRVREVNPVWASVALYSADDGRQLLNSERPLADDLPALPAAALEEVRLTGATRIATALDRTDPVTGRPLLLVKAPVLVAGQVRQVVVVLLRAEPLQQAMEAEQVPPAWTAALNDAHGRVIARNKDAATFFGRTITPTLREAVARDRSGIFRSQTLDGTPTYTAFTRLPFSRWVFVIGVPQDELDPVRDRALVGTLVGAGFAVLLALVMAFLIGRSIAERRAIALREAQLQAEQKRASEAERALQEKNFLLNEINHRVKNNLQIVASLLNLQAGRIPTAELRRYFDDARQRVMAIASIHATLYRDPRGDRVEFGSYLRSLCAGLAEGLVVDGSIAVDVEAEAAELPIDRAIAVGLIVNELVTNAVRHGFPPGATGEVQVRFAAVDGQYRLTIADDGRGLPASDEADDGGGLGMRLVRAFVLQVDGKLESSTGPQGTTFTLVMPA